MERPRRRAKPIRNTLEIQSAFGTAQEITTWLVSKGIEIGDIVDLDDGEKVAMHFSTGERIFRITVSQLASLDDVEDAKYVEEQADDRRHWRRRTRLRDASIIACASE